MKSQISNSFEETQNIAKVDKSDNLYKKDLGPITRQFIWCLQPFFIDRTRETTPKYTCQFVAKLRIKPVLILDEHGPPMGIHPVFVALSNIKRTPGYGVSEYVCVKHILHIRWYNVKAST